MSHPQQPHDHEHPQNEHGDDCGCDADDVAAEQQQDLAEASLDLLFEMYDEGREQGMQDPVVMLLDCEDELGGEIARVILGEEAVDEAIAERDPEDETTVFAHAYPWMELSAELCAAFPYLSPVFEGEPPTDGFMTVSVTAGGACALTVPWDARPDENALDDDDDFDDDFDDDADEDADDESEE